VLNWSIFNRRFVLVLELDKIQTINELLCVKFGLISLSFLDATQVDFMLEAL